MRRPVSPWSPTLFAAAAVAVAWTLRAAFVGLAPVHAVLLFPSVQLRLPVAVSPWWDVPAAALWAWTYLRLRAGAKEEPVPFFDLIALPLCGAVAAAAFGLGATLLGALAVGFAAGLVSCVVMALVRKTAALFRTRVDALTLRDLVVAGTEAGGTFGMLFALGAGVIVGLPVGAAFGAAVFLGVAVGMAASFVLLRLLAKLLG